MKTIIIGVVVIIIGFYIAIEIKDPIGSLFCGFISGVLLSFPFQKERGV